MLLHKMNVKKGQCLTKDGKTFNLNFNGEKLELEIISPTHIQIKSDSFRGRPYVSKLKDLSYPMFDLLRSRGYIKGETKTSRSTVFVTDGALSDLFGGLADGLLEVTEKEARDSASDWYDDLGLDEDTKALIDLFCSKKKIKDHEDLHELAEELGIEPSLLEEKVYALIQAFFSEGRYMSSDAGNIDSKELEMGDKVELEHTKSPIIARRIALDHLAELPDYYTRLAKMEGEGKETSDGGTGSGIKGHVTAEQMKAMKERRIRN